MSRLVPGPASKAQNQSQAVVDPGQEVSGQVADGGDEPGPVDDERLRHVDDAVLGQTRVCTRQFDIARRRQTQIAGDRGYDDGGDAGPVEAVGRDDQGRAQVGGFRADGLAEIDPCRL